MGGVAMPFGDSDRTDRLLEKKSLKIEVFELLRRRIVGGEYSPGEWLRQEEIARELGVSPTPVREALDQLVAEGLAEGIPYRGVRVPKLTDEEIADAYVLRLLLEVTAARLATHNISQEQADALRATLHKTEELLDSEDMSVYQHLNRQLHRGIVAASGNQLLMRLYELVVNRFPDWMLYGDLIEQPEVRARALKQDFEGHRAIVEAVISGDADLASRRVVEHMHSVGDELEAWREVSRRLLSERERQIQALIPEPEG
jgi:DNA-binding GntR family transcriptional regulator